MTVRELIEVLQDLNPGAIVVLSKDAEGNGFSPLQGKLTGVDVGHYEPRSTWAGDFESAPEALRASAPAVCLWPEN
jgi:hypothetical protein